MKPKKSNSRLRLAALTAVLALSFSALAAESVSAEGGRQTLDAKTREMQQKMKERLLKHVEARIRILEDSRACIKAAADMQAMGDCHEQERRRTKELRDQAQADFQERKSPPPAQSPR